MQRLQLIKYMRLSEELDKLFLGSKSYLSASICFILYIRRKRNFVKLLAMPH